MQTLKKLTLAAAILTTTIAAQAGWVDGHYRSDGTYVQPYYRSDSSRYVAGPAGFTYRNPYAADPSVHVDGYLWSNGKYVQPHVRTAPNDTVTDNLNYRGYGTIRVPRKYYNP